MKIRMYRSCLINKMIEKFRKASLYVDPNNYNKRISNLSTNELIKQGAELLKKEGFKIATEEVIKGL